MNEINYLKQLGLNEYQARVLAILLRENATARRISEATGVYQQDVYRLVRELFEKGINISSAGEPRIFLKITPTQIGKLVYKKRSELETLCRWYESLPRRTALPPLKIQIRRRLSDEL